MALLEDAGREEGHDELLLAVDLLGHLDERLPFLGVIDDAGDLDVVLPVVNVFDDDLVRRVDGEGAGRADRPGFGDAPGVHDIVLAVLRVGVALAEGGAHDDAEGLILVDKALGLAAVHDLEQVFACS